MRKIFVLILVFFCLTSNAQLTSGLSAYYKLDETSGTTVYNAKSAGSISGTVTGATINQTGIIGKAVSFDGNDVIVLEDTVTLQGYNSMMTFACWVYLRAYPVPTLYDYIIAGETSALALHINSDGALAARSMGSFVAPVSTATIPLNQWVYVAMDWKYTAYGIADTVIYHVNLTSEQVLTSTQFSIATGASSMYIGSQNSSGTSGAIDAIIDEFGIWKGVILTDEQHDSLYNSGVGLTYPFVAEIVPAIIPESHSSILYFNEYYTDAIVPVYGEPDIPPDTITNDFSGTVLYVDAPSPVGIGSDANNGLTAGTPITITGISAKINNTFDYLVLSDTTHYGTIVIDNIDRPYGDPLIIRTWNKYNKGYFDIVGLTEVTGWTQVGNYWTKSGLTGLPSYQNDIFNSTGKDDNIYMISLANGIYINGVYYKIGKYPNSKTYYSVDAVETGAVGKNLWVRDNSFNGVYANDYWNGGTIVYEGATWILGKSLISDYSSTGTYTLGTGYNWGGHETRVGTKYFIMNHRNTLDVNGEWWQNTSTNAIEVYYTGDLNAQEVWVPLQNYCIQISNSEHITIDKGNFWGANKIQVEVVNSIGVTVQNSNFYRSPFAGVGAYGADTLNISYNNSYYSSDNGFFSTMGDDETYRYNYVRGAGVDGTFGGSRDMTHLHGISSTHYYGDLIVEYNVIDSTGSAGINLNNSYSDADVWHYRNWSNWACMVVSDNAAFYNSNNQSLLQKNVRGNLATNVFSNTAFHWNNGDGASIGIYFDSAYPTDGTVDNTNWLADSNSMYNCAMTFLNNINTNNVVYRNNLSVSMTSYANENDWGWFYKNTTNALQVPVLCRNVRNTYVMGPNGSGIFGNIPGWNEFTPSTNHSDSNKYYNPFSTSTDVWRCINNASGSPAWYINKFTLAEFRALTTWEDNSTLDDPSWKMTDVTGITNDQMIWFFANWSDAAHSFSLESTVFRDIDGNDVSGSITLDPYKSQVLFYKSGGVPSFSTLNVYR